MVDVWDDSILARRPSLQLPKNRKLSCRTELLSFSCDHADQNVNYSPGSPSLLMFDVDHSCLESGLPFSSISFWLCPLQTHLQANIRDTH